MYKKQISDNARPSFFAELKKEFGTYFESFSDFLNSLILKYPRQLFAVMIILILLSGSLAFSVLRPARKQLGKSEEKLTASFGNGVGEITRSVTDLKTALALRDEIASLLNKPKLDKRDTVLLEAALKKLNEIYQSNNPTKTKP